MDLRDFQVYTEEEVDTFSSRYLNQADRDDLDPILDRCVERYRDLNASKQTDFKAKARSFKRSYPFLAQIITFTAPEWERLFWFLKYLLLKLPPLNDEDLAPGVRESVDMDTYRVQKQATHTISLSGQPGEVDPSTAKAGGGSSEPDMEYLSQIVHDFNERFGHHFETEQARDRARRTVVEDLPNEIEADDDVMETLAASDQQNARITMEKEVWEKMQNLFDNQFMVYKLFTDNPDFREFVKDEVFRIVYEKILEREETPS
jgi:type I restriction enzyme R subunit